MSALATPLLAALATGLLGSLHCAAMCGPLVAAAALGPRPRRDGALYFAGRFVSYATVGALVGHLGRHALCRLPVEPVQRLALLVVAAVAVARAVALLRGPRPARPIPLGRRSPSRFAWIAAALPRRGLGLGLATGLLPCGMLVPAWVLAASTEQAPGGALVMIVFAAASAPGLLVPIVGRPLLARLAGRLPSRMQGAAWLLLATWLAARPLLASVHHHH